MRFIVQLNQDLFKWSQTVHRDEEGRPLDWVLVIRADQLQPQDDCHYVDSLFNVLNVALASEAAHSKGFGIVTLAGAAGESTGR